MKYLVYNVVAILLILLAAYMVYADKQNYGWVIFAALLCAVVPRTSNSKDENEDDD